MELMNIINNSKLQPQNMTIEELFHIILFELGFSFSLLGTQYLEELFSLAYNKYENTCDIKITDLYQDLARLHDTSVNAISRAIRYSITVAWDKGNTRLQNELFGYTVDPERGKPTLLEFLCLVMELLKL